MVSWRGDDGQELSSGPIPFGSSLTPDDRKDLRWYLEDFLQFPYGAERWRAEQIEKRMAIWGEKLFDQVFVNNGSRADSRAIYREAVRGGLDRCELCINSDDAAFLNIPWELVREPGAGPRSGRYLALLLHGLYRQRSAQASEPRSAFAGAGPLRLLLVIARPAGAAYIPLKTDARAILDAVRPLGSRVQVEVLRPPTVDELQKRLNANPSFYQLVHFDGHGVFAGGSGHLAFEKRDGTADLVSSERLGQLLANCRVPLFVLSACQSAEEGKADPFSSVASQLMSVGVSGVVAMSYSVYVETATMFMERLYEEMANHSALSVAVAAARSRLYAEPDRESVIGPVTLQDWMVPALYQQLPGFVPMPRDSGPAGLEEQEKAAVDVRGQAEEACPDGRYGFIGRDDDILKIERALRDGDNPCVLLSGVGGVGKTELARGFARWYAETGGCPGGVFATSFKEKADFSQVIGSVGGFGTDFSRLNDEEQVEVVVAYLREHACLLVWDNFEVVAGYPSGAEPLASEPERAKLSRFLKDLKGGRSRVLITTRKPQEDWLTVAYQLVELQGLGERDAGRMAKAILQIVGREPQDYRDEPNYSQLISLLQGHPRSLETVLPQLRRIGPAEAIEALQERIDDLGEAVEDASLSLAFLQLSGRTQRHLPILGLFVSRVNAGILTVLSQHGPDDETHERGIERLDASQWQGVLDEATEAGLIRHDAGHAYELHATLAPFLRRQLVSQAGKEALTQLDEVFVDVYAAWSDAVLDGARKSELGTLVAIASEEGNLLRAVRIGAAGERWRSVQATSGTLGEFYNARGRAREWRALRHGLLDHVGTEATIASDVSRASLWAQLMGQEGQDARKRNELDRAEEAFRRILAYCTSVHDLRWEPKIAFSYNELGMVAKQRRRFDEAEEMFRSALKIDERRGEERDAAVDCHQLGMVAEERNRIDEAGRWYGRALEIRERLGLDYDAASDYHHLGNVAFIRRNWSDAEHWYRKALRFYEEMRLPREAASEYHNLGNIALERELLDGADEWYRKALEICEQEGLEFEVAREYHQLGTIAQARHRLDEAEQWYIRALEVHERMDLPRHAADQYHNLGRVACERERLDEAKSWYEKALDAYGSSGTPHLMLGTLEALGRLELGRLDLAQGSVVDAVARFGNALTIAEDQGMDSMAVRAAVGLFAIMEVVGEQKFRAAWRQAFPDQEPPLEALRKFQD